jgi:hypothetical protein
MLQLPALFVLMVLASTYAVLLHLLLGRGVRDLVLFWVASVAGFACGQLVGERLDFIPWQVGQVHLIEATVGAVLFILAAAWLRPQVKKA